MDITIVAPYSYVVIVFVVLLLIIFIGIAIRNAKRMDEREEEAPAECPPLIGVLPIAEPDTDIKLVLQSRHKNVVDELERIRKESHEQENRYEYLVGEKARLEKMLAQL